MDESIYHWLKFFAYITISNPRYLGFSAENRVDSINILVNHSRILSVNENGEKEDIERIDPNDEEFNV